MKTTINIPDSLFQDAKRLAVAEKTTLRSLIEEGLRAIVRDRNRGAAFRLAKASFKGKGLQGPRSASWEELRGLAYEGHGG